MEFFYVMYVEQKLLPKGLSPKVYFFYFLTIQNLLFILRKYLQFFQSIICLKNVKYVDSGLLYTV